MLFGEAVKDELLAVLFDEADKELRAQWETNSRRLAAASAEETNGRRLAAASADLPDNDPGTPALLRSTSWDKELRAQWKTNSRRLAAASADQRDDVDLELQKGLELSLDAARLPTGAVQEDALRNYELFHQLKGPAKRGRLPNNALVTCIPPFLITIQDCAARAEAHVSVVCADRDRPGHRGTHMYTDRPAALRPACCWAF